MPGAELYVIRHAIAEERGEAWPDDDKRPLSADGASRMRKAAKGLERLGVRFDVVLSSPLVRARQTAEVVSAVYVQRPPIVVIESLVPEGSPVAVLADLGKQGRRSRIALVGHEPSIGMLAARLIGAKMPVPFKKGAVCRIDVDELPPTGAGQLRWFLTPAMLRGLRK